MKIAIIDMGTNTFTSWWRNRKSRFQNFSSTETSREIGVGGINEGIITESGVGRPSRLKKIQKTTRMK